MKPTYIDQTFLRVHPRTLAWWAEREQCLRCKHSRQRPVISANSGGGLLCMRSNAVAGDATCISARERVAGCGPSGRLFEAKEK